MSRSRDGRENSWKEFGKSTEQALVSFDILKGWWKLFFLHYPTSQKTIALILFMKWVCAEKSARVPGGEGLPKVESEGSRKWYGATASLCGFRRT